MQEDSEHRDDSVEKRAHADPSTTERGESDLEDDLFPAAVPTARRPATTISPVTVMVGLIVVLLALLVGVSVKNRKPGVRASADDPAIAAMAADLAAQRLAFNRERIEMGMPPIEGQTESLADISTRLTRDAETLVSLSSRFEEMLAAKDRELMSRSSELLKSEQMRQAMLTQNSSLQADLQRALVAASDGDLLRNSLSDMQARNDALAAELANARNQLAANTGGPSDDDFADLQRRFAEASNARDFYQKRIAELEQELAKGRLFANTEAELLPAAVELLRMLREMEGEADFDPTVTYPDLELEANATLMNTLTFPTGVSELSAEDVALLGKAVNEVPDGDLVLVVGYASTTGEVESNQKLSSARATAAATAFAEAKRPAQMVQAVFLGLTDRFSERVPERNQICEIWHIRPN